MTNNFAHFSDNNAIGLFTSAAGIVPVAEFPTKVPSPMATALSHPARSYPNGFYDAAMLFPPSAIWPGATPIV